MSTPYEKVTERLLQIAERGRVFVEMLGSDGYYAREYIDGSEGFTVGPHLTGYEAKVELALKVLESEFETR